MNRDFVGIRRYRRLLRNGTIKKPKNCGECGNEGIIEGHHPDYSKGMEVIFLCQTCHVLKHQK